MRSMDPDYFKRLEQFIDDYMDEYGRSPTTREIAAGTGRALSTVHKYLSQMRTEGVLDYAGHRNITTRRRKKMAEESVQVPVLGKVSCGALKFAEESIEEYVHLPVALFGRGKYFLLRANGDSMIDAGIGDADLGGHVCIAKDEPGNSWLGKQNCCWNPIGVCVGPPSGSAMLRMMMDIVFVMKISIGP